MGPPGSPGIPGPAGQPGKSGDNGPPGAVGPKGDKGERGDFAPQNMMRSIARQVCEQLVSAQMTRVNTLLNQIPNGMYRSNSPGPAGPPGPPGRQGPAGEPGAAGRTASPEVQVYLGSRERESQNKWLLPAAVNMLESSSRETSSDTESRKAQLCNMFLIVLASFSSTMDEK
ncbi:collagen alpha-1(XII) chain [Lates calcarifer]|uniref:Collagen alpha-1(XII) chain n=1 Tax=Lates calcarifer TaxID=8187 RepID=A0AAJ7LAE9_LATCA|nr:collagen alpha-1(XII) chain [Lates calcarifer]